MCSAFGIRTYVFNYSNVTHMYAELLSMNYYETLN